MRYARWRCAYRAYKKRNTVGRIRRLRRHPAIMMPGGAVLTGPTKAQYRRPDKALTPPSGNNLKEPS
ncbi:hypothetical protein EVX99_14395 [Citrobacter koseri]|nr:hypothetical protein EVX99_14395 [Citrobacter koseri]